MAQAAALAVGVPIPASRSALEALVAHLATREALLVLDNCEHLIDACARLAEEILRAGPGVRVLATSREPLRCADEVAWRVPSLAEAERLFCERAAAARPGFGPADGATGAVAEICRRLDGMPLAIELAAARAAALSLDQIAARLGDSLDVLGAGRRTALTRQQTLRATIDWSHDLLTGEERVLHRRLAVFAGGFTLEAAEEVCAGGAIARRQVVDLLARLVEKSLVVAEGERFRLLDTVRQYAAERLEAAAERDTLALRHLDWCLALAEQHDPLSAGQRRSLHVLETEHDNLRAGLAWALRRDPQAALRLATRLWRFWLDRGYFAEGNRWLQTTLAAAPERTPLRVEALLAGAGLSLRLGDPNGFLRHVSDAVSAYRLLGDERATAAALYQHAMLAQFVHRADAGALFAEALALARRLDDDRLLAAATHASATLPWYRGDHASRSRAGARGPRSARRGARRRHAVLRRGDVRDVPARRRAGRSAADVLGGDGLPVSPLRPRPGDRLRAQQPRLGRSRRWRPRAGAGRHSTMRSRASGACRTGGARRSHSRTWATSRARWATTRPRACVWRRRSRSAATSAIAAPCSAPG